MHSLSGLSTLPSILIYALAGCASSGDTQDELVNEAASTGGADTTASGATGEAYTYYAISADVRKCASPMCGGWFFKQLNHPTTKCFDGSAASCYAPVLDWSEANLSDARQARLLDAARTRDGFGGVYAIVRGRFSRSEVPTFAPDLGQFVITEGWVAEGETSSAGVFVKVEDNGLRCLVAPCPDMTEWTLNMAAVSDIAAVDFTPAELSPAKIEHCRAAIDSPDGLLVAGERYAVYGQAGTAKGRTVNAAYYRLGDTPK